MRLLGDVFDRHGPAASSDEEGETLAIHWRARFLSGGVETLLHDAPPPGRWSVRAMAAAYGLSPSTVRRIWTGHGLLPHLVAPFVPLGDEDSS